MASGWQLEVHYSPATHSIQPSTHSPWPLTSRDFPPYVSLVVGSYGATPLLNFTAQNFHECELRPQQAAARAGFKKIYRDALILSQAWRNLTPEALKSFEKGGGSEEVKSMAQSLESALYTMMLHLDDFYFLGALTRPHHNLTASSQTHSLTKLETGFGVLKGTVSAAAGRPGEAEEHRGDGGWFSVIRLWLKCSTSAIWNSFCGEESFDIIPFEESVVVLIHEMVHAYLQMFLCRRPQCERDRLNTDGLSGHGRTFQKLLALITVEFQGWHGSLRNIIEDRCYEGTWVDSFNDDVEQAAIEAARSRGELAQYLPLRADSCRTLVRIVNKELPNGERTSNVIYRQPGSDIPPKADEDPDYVYDEDGDVNMDL
ncbi:hypothetical protein JMJ76_0007394 [Colletotrichum scovillei]|nr:hypothetical protein JMJ76_0007394 [Colletotrichum scovillei]